MKNDVEFVWQLIEHETVILQEGLIVIARSFSGKQRLMQNN